jgi:transposase-like protein
LGFLRVWVLVRIEALPLDTEQGIYPFVKMLDPDARRAAVALLRRGTITVSEVAALAGVSRQVVRYWCKAARIDIGKARSLMLAKAWRRTLRRSE